MAELLEDAFDDDVATAARPPPAPPKTKKPQSSSSRTNRAQYSSSRTNKAQPSLSRTSKVQSSSRTNRAQSSSRTNNAQSLLRANRAQSSSRTNRAQSSSRTNNAQSSLRANRAQSSSRTNRAQSSSRANRAQSSSRTNRPQSEPSITKRSSPISKKKYRPKTAEPKQKCRSRIDQLAIPSRRLILALYQDHANHLPRDKVEKIKVLLQELYAMTPEETEKYFEHLKQRASEAARRKDIKFMLKRLVKKRSKAKQKKEAYQFLTNLLIKGMLFASKNSIPPLVSVRLRNLSNIVLEQICDLRNVTIPSREDPDRTGAFLIQVADWMAIAIEHLYYGVQLKKNAELEKIEKEATTRERERKEREIKEKTKLDLTDTEKGEDEAILSEELLVSEME